MKAAQIEFERLQNAYPAVGYEVALLPKPMWQSVLTTYCKSCQITDTLPSEKSRKWDGLSAAHFSRNTPSVASESFPAASQVSL